MFHVKPDTVPNGIQNQTNINKPVQIYTFHVEHNQ
jgi:hypothetical protein